jgi:hypothetical protein
MSPPSAPNPERSSNAAIWLVCGGVALATLSWFLGVGAVMALALSGQEDPHTIIAAAFGAIGVMMLGALGVLLTIIGGVWMFAQVIADQRGGEEKRYRDVER